MLISVTRLRVRRLHKLPAFLWYTFFSQRQARHASGFLGGRLLVDAKHTYWTLTGWQDEKAMKAFRGAGAHSRVMPRLFQWCDEAAYVHWTTPDDALPDWPEAHARLVSDGKLSRVEAPSEDHTARRFPAPRLHPRIEQNLSPPKKSAA